MKNATQKKKEDVQINNQFDPGHERSYFESDYIDYILGYDNKDSEYDQNSFYEELPIEKWFFD